jgi:hypothetical protein
MLSGFMVGHIEHLTMIDVLVWLPLIFLLFEKALTKGSVAYAASAGFFLGISLLAGHPQTSHTIFYVLVIHAVYRSASRYTAEKDPVIFLRSASVAVITFVIGLLIAAVQILPTYEFVQDSTRAGALTFKHSVSGWQFFFEDAILLLVPNYFGAVSGHYWGITDISQNLIYIGVLPFLLIGPAILFSRKNTAVMYFFVMAVLGLLVSLGEHGFIYSLLYDYVPIFDHFRAPVNSIFIYTFFAALLAGFGFNALSGNRKMVVIFYFVVFFALSVVLYLLSPAPPKIFAELVIQNSRDGFALYGAFFLVSSLFIMLYIYFPSFKNLWCALLLVLTFADFYITYAHGVTLGDKDGPEILERQPRIISAIKRLSGTNDGKEMAAEFDNVVDEQSLFRLYTKPKGLMGTAAVGHARTMLHRIFLVEGYDPLILTRHDRLVEVLAEKNYGNFLKINNVKYIAREDPQSGMTRLEYYPDSLPRVFMVGKARFISDDERVLEELASRGFDPSHEVIFSGKGRDTGQPMAPGDWTATVTRYSANEVEILTGSNKEGFLVLSDTFYPGWRAWVDGEEVPVLRANYDFRALALPQGEHTVVFKFMPLSFKVGLVASLIGLSLVGLIFVCNGYNTYRSKGFRLPFPFGSERSRR